MAFSNCPCAIDLVRQAQTKSHKGDNKSNVLKFIINGQILTIIPELCESNTIT